MGNGKHFSIALAIVAVAMGIDFATGRDLSAFYAQMGGACWLGVGLAALVFGLLTVMLAHLSRRAGADSMGALLRRLLGEKLGKGMALLYGLILCVAAAMALGAAGHMGALMLPLRRSQIWGMGMAVLLAGWIAMGGPRTIQISSGLFVGCMALFELALLFFGEMPDRSQLNYELELKLRGNVPAALLFALVHASVCACLSAGVALRMSKGRVRPWRLGLWAGGLFLLLLTGGNAALMVQKQELLLLQLPLVALASGWGKAGFYFSAILSYFAAVTTLAGIFYALLPRSIARNLGNYDVKF